VPTSNTPVTASALPFQRAVNAPSAVRSSAPAAAQAMCSVPDSAPSERSDAIRIVTRSPELV